MKYLIVLYLFVLTATASCSAQEIFPESYYYIQKDNTIKFEQKGDSVFVTKSNRDGYLKSKPDKYLAIEDYIVLNDSIIEFHYKDAKTKTKYILTNTNKNRKRLQYIYVVTQNQSDNILLYPNTELKDLKSIDLITSEEIDSINEKYIKFLKAYFNSNPVNSDDNAIWEKFNELVMAKGYNPIGAEPILMKSLKEQ